MMGHASARPVSKISRGQRCPICKSPAELLFNPFCSARCADVDLSRWLSGSYAIAGGGQDADEDGDDTHAEQRSGATSHDDDHS